MVLVGMISLFYLELLSFRRHCLWVCHSKASSKIENKKEKEKEREKKALVVWRVSRKGTCPSYFQHLNSLLLHDLLIRSQRSFSFSLPLLYLLIRLSSLYPFIFIFCFITYSLFDSFLFSLFFSPSSACTTLVCSCGDNL